MHRMVLLLALSMAAGLSAQAAQIYKWVDAQGVTHFDSTPPAGQQSAPVDMQRPPLSGSVAAPPMPEPDARQQAIDNRVKQEVSDAEAKRNAICEVMRTNLAQLKNNPRVRVPAEGGFKRMNEEERRARIAESQKAITDYCN